MFRRTWKKYVFFRAVTLFQNLKHMDGSYIDYENEHRKKKEK